MIFKNRAYRKFLCEEGRSTLRPRSHSPLGMMNRRLVANHWAMSVAIGGTIVLATRPAAASFIDFGVDGGVLKRSLSNTDYKTSFAWQLHGEVTFFPLLMIGPYATFTSAGAQ